MALEKEGYHAAIRGTTKVKLGIDSNGNIIVDDNEPVAGSKQLSINQVNAANSYKDNDDVIKVFLGFVGAEYDQYSNKMTVTWGLT